MGWVTVLVSVVIIILTLIGALIFIIHFVGAGRRIDFEPNLNKVWNLLPEFADGHAEGLEKEAIPDKNGNYLVRFIPTDYKVKEDSFDMPDVRVHEMVIGRGYRIVLPMGKLSKERNIVLYLSKDTQRLMDLFGKGKLGDVLCAQSIYQKVENTLFDGIKEGDERLYSQVVDWGKGQMSRDTIDRLAETFAEGLRQIQEQTAQQLTKEKGK